MAAFNASAGQRYNRWLQDMRRHYGKDLQYAKAAEVQAGSRRSDGEGRRALHFHVLIRVDRSDRVLKEYRKGDPGCFMRALAEKHGFGHEIDVQVVNPSTSCYCAKYVSKTADDRDDMPWLDVTTGELGFGNRRYRPWTTSRDWGLTMKAVRSLQALWVQQRSAAGDMPGGRAAGPEPGHAAAGGPLDTNTESYTETSSARP